MNCLKATLVVFLLLAPLVPASHALAASHSASLPTGPSIQLDEPTPTPTPLPPNAPIECSAGC